MVDIEVVGATLVMALGTMATVMAYVGLLGAVRAVRLLRCAR